MQVARRAGIREVRLYPSFTQDSKKNPLPHREKVKWLSKFFKGVKVINSTDARTPFAAARQISDQGFKRVIMIAGGDRIKEFQSQISKYIKHPDPDKSFEFDEFQVVSAGERDPDADDASGMSASKMRAFAAAGDFDNFSKGLPSRANQKDASNLFAAIRRGMNLKENMSAEENESLFIHQLQTLNSPDIAEAGKCYSVVWADGRGVVAYRNRIDAVRFIESGDRDVVSINYQDATRQSGRSLMVRNKFVPDRSSIDEEWPDTFETYDAVLARVNENLEQLDEAPQSQSMWYNSSKAKFVKVPAGGGHAHTVRTKTKEFGLKKADLAKLDFIELIEFMKKNGWARVTVIPREGWFIEANNVTLARKTAQALDQKFPRPKNIFLEHGRSSTNLSGNQIVPFLKTGKVVRLSKLAAFRDHVELDEAITSVWWYNSRTKKSVKVTGKFFIHADVIEQDPEKLGLTDKDVLSMSGAKKNDLATRDFYSDKLADLLKKRGWAELSLTENVTSRGKDEANIRTNSNREAQGALKWILNTFRPSLERVFISNIKAPKNVVLQGGQIDQFAKTGKVTQLTDIGRTMARFR